MDVEKVIRPDEIEGEVEAIPVMDSDGHWNRTNMPRANGGDIDISEIKKGYLFFSASLMAEGNSGMISGMAKIISTNEAV